MRTLTSKRWAARMLGGGAAAALSLSFAGVTSAAVKREGEWPSRDKAITLDLDGVPRNEALKRLAGEAGWSVIVNAPAADRVDIHVKGQPAGKVLDLLLADGDYVVHRDGSLLAISRASVAAVPTAALEADSIPAPLLPLGPPAPQGLLGLPAPTQVAGPEAPAQGPSEAVPEGDAAGEAPAAAAAAAHDDDDDDDSDDGEERAAGGEHGKKRNRDRSVVGTNLRIEKDEVVHDVSVVGGSLEVLGNVTGDITIAGGNVTLRNGARVRGDVSTMGGSITVEDGARIDGDIGVRGGSLQRGEKAILAGNVDATTHNEDEEGFSLQRALNDAGDAVTRMAFLFVLGAVLLALAPGRMDTLKVEIAAHPMRSFARGIVGILTGIVMLAAMCITIIGIPFAAVGFLAAILAVFIASCSVLETAGAAVLGHRTRNPYVHLAAGCAGLLVLGALPYVGNIVWAAVLLTGAGALVSTRAAGLVKPRASTAAAAATHPFRSLFG
ncbi:polymer-forming cytoskeletal protein [Chondromyces apiculatus]|uniref:DUF8173 domain-containing protein n=1 Tax=Chondromyces apiculatus DSM 436 TaxID=1192034 RepID=A0A017T0U1_9BACT|nr:polymer-forming cytoskeletal protein [Chondromyces apiculatus]EYF02166.1 Hypothetical protein CAP_7377 [Chondromyces apiculatus DSM 436]